jgi:hypothetical protein
MSFLLQFSTYVLCTHWGKIDLDPDRNFLDDSMFLGKRAPPRFSDGWDGGGGG